MLVVARFLDRHQFGALAMINVTAAIVLAFQDMGLSSFCIHIGSVPRRTHATLYWISAGLGLLGTLIVLVLAVPLASFYRIPELRYSLPILGVNFVLIGLSAQYQANLVRTFQAKRLARIELIARCIGFTVTVGLITIRSMGVLAVVAGLIVFSFCKLIMMVRAADRDWHPAWSFDRELAPRALRYGLFQAGSQIVNQLRSQADQLILGRALGPESLGIYSLAKELISYPLRLMQPLFSRLTLPVLAMSQGDEQQLNGRFLKSLRQTAVTSALTYCLIAFFAPWMVEVMYGDRFAIVASIVPLFALFGALRPLGMNAGMLAQATGRTSREFSWNMLAALVTLPCNALVAMWWPSVAGFAIDNSALQVVLTLLAYPYFIRPLVRIGTRRYVAAWAWPFAATLAISIVSLVYPVPSILPLEHSLKALIF